MEAPDLDLYATEALDDGIRIYRSDDAVFDARVTEGTETRLYTDGETWYAKARFPETDVEDAYNRLMEAADQVEETYGTVLDIAPRDFLDKADVDRPEADGEVHISTDDTAIHYMADTDLDTLIDDLFDEPSRASIVKGALASSGVEVGLGSLVGAGIGAAIGSLGGPPGMVAGAATGAAFGGVGTGAIAAAEGGAAIIALTKPKQLNLDAGYPMTRAVRFFEERRKKKYRAIDAVDDHLDSVNKLHSMEQELEDIREMDLDRHKELEELQDSDIEDIHDVLMEVHFHQFEENEGATMTYEADTYAEAREFLTTVTDDIVLPNQRPSLYTAPDAFATVFDGLTYTERGETKYFDDAQVMVENVYDRGRVADEVTEWLELHHRSLVQDIGRGRAMKGAGQRHENRYGHGQDEDPQ